MLSFMHTIQFQKEAESMEKDDGQEEEEEDAAATSDTEDALEEYINPSQTPLDYSSARKVYIVVSLDENCFSE